MARRAARRRCGADHGRRQSWASGPGSQEPLCGGSRGMSAQQSLDPAPEFSARVLRDVSMAKHPSWRAGGPADLFFTPRDIMDLASFVRQLPPEVPLLWLGLGSNLLVRDGGVRGAVVATHGALRAHRAAMRQVGFGTRGIFCRDPGNARRRAGDECRGVGRRDLEARGRSGGARSQGRTAYAHAGRLPNRLSPRERARQRAVDRGRGPQRLSHRRCVGVAEARQFHHQSWVCPRRRHRGVDFARAEDRRRGSGHPAAHRSAHRRRAGRRWRPDVSLLKESAMRRAGSPKEFGKTAVLLGGDSSEREISLLSGNAVLAALKRRGVDAHGFDPLDRPIQALRSEGFERAWISLHGPGGEDGTMQGALEWIGVPYTGSGVLASALTMDKLKTKRVGVGAGYAAPGYAVLSSAADLAPALARIGLPMMVKPASQGSSVGMTKVKAAAELDGAYAAAQAIDPVVFRSEEHT